MDSQRDTKRNKTKTARIGLNTHPPKVFLCFPSSKTTYGIKDGESKCVFHPFLNRNQFLRGIYPILKASIVVDVMIFIIRGKKKDPIFFPDAKIYLHDNMDLVLIYISPILLYLRKIKEEMGTKNTNIYGDSTVNLPRCRCYRRMRSDY